jgi:hydrogenase-4 membrane subunit HyfE
VSKKKLKKGDLMKIFHLIAACLIAILGVIHTAMTPVFYHAFTLDAIWFAGTGLALVFLGLLNIAANKSALSSNFNLCIVANLICTIYFFLLVIILPEPHAFAGVVFILGLFMSSILMRIKLEKMLPDNQ